MTKFRNSEGQKSFLKWLLLFLMIAVVAWFISKFWIQLMLIQGDSMLPSYHNMQIVLVDKHFDTLNTDDVIVFECEELNAVLVKRIKGLPGQTISVDGILYEIGDNEYFVMGDNTQESVDSRNPSVGNVELKDVIGIVIR